MILSPNIVALAHCIECLPVGKRDRESKIMDAGHFTCIAKEDFRNAILEWLKQNPVRDKAKEQRGQNQYCSARKLL